MASSFSFSNLVFWTIGLFALLLSFGCKPNNSPSKTELQATPANLPTPTFASPQECYSCHQEEYQAWQKSHHAKAMLPANEQTVLGNFDNATFTQDGKTSTFFKKGSDYYVNTEGPDGKTQDFKIAYTFGVTPLQQYLIAFPQGRLQSLTLAWDDQAKRWYSLYPDGSIPHDDPLHWTQVHQTWNHMCAECHSTNLQKNYHSETDTYHTTWSEINVGCQACHGPGSNHIAWAKNPELALNTSTKGLTTKLTASNPKDLVDSCAACHSRRQQMSPDDSPGESFYQHFLPSLLEDNLYHPDGQIDDEVYVYGSFIQSKMYHHGVSCIDCHNPHSYELVAPGNALCLQCHNTTPPTDRFPTLQIKDYNSPSHHFHQTGSTGAACVNCHMPEKTYMGIDTRPDHSLRIPRPDLTLKIGSPNACNQCHTEETPQWAQQHVEKWYGPKKHSTHYGEAFFLAQANDSHALPALLHLINDTEQPFIVRATAVDYLERFPGEQSLAAIITSLKDPHPLLRATALRALNRYPNTVKQDHAPALLADKFNTVRLSAVQTLNSIPTDELPPQYRTQFEREKKNYRALLDAISDTPAGLMNLGIFYDQQALFDLAAAAYERATQLDRFHLPAWVNLGNAYNRAGNNTAAEKALRQAIQIAPQDGELHYSLGLLLAEEKRLPEATQALGKASELLPQRARIHYNYALALQSQQKRQLAEQAFLKAKKIEPQNPDFLYALALFYLQQNQPQKAQSVVNELSLLLPNSPVIQSLLAQIRAQQE